MPTEDLRFKEIEHKFIVDGHFDLARLGAVLNGLGPVRTSHVSVRDRYVLTDGGRSRRYVIRHRYDEELHQLTLKTLEADTEVRVEINLDLGHQAGDQRAAVDAFLEQLGVLWRGALTKDLHVWYFADCEIVHYEATTSERTVHCVEFEAKGARALGEALAILDKYERATGFDAATRSHAPLLQLLFPELTELVGP